ncbi:MAG: hypothetical protein KC455_03325 [Carnobacterium sp.]|nr:hypothetical protein [Carnobacterium sp.]
MVDKHFADTYLEGTVPKIGMSQPVMIQADNGKKYFLKTDIVQNEKQDAVFFQELLCSLLAEHIGIPVPNFAIIEIEKDFIENNPNLRFGEKFKNGFYFATEKIADVEDNLSENYAMARQNGMPRIVKAWNSFFKNIDNSEKISDIIAFDLLTLNFDRFNNEGNILVSKNDIGERKIHAIDHGHCFYGPFYKKNIIVKHQILEYNNFPISSVDKRNEFINWHLNTLSGRKFNLGLIFAGLEQNIDFDSKNPFAEVIENIEHLDEDAIFAMIDTIPEIWITGGDVQKNLYLNFLIRQKDIIRYIIDALVAKDVFSNHRGGVLNWKTQEMSRGIQL